MTASPSARSGQGSGRILPEVAIAIINYNTRERLRACLTTLLESVGDAPFETLVIDNASHDGSAVMVAREFSGRVDLVANKANLGFARAVNQALELTACPFVLVLNADIEVRPGAIEALLAFMKTHPDAGLAGGQLLGPDGEVQPSCRRFYTAGAVLMRRTPLGLLLPGSRTVRRHLMLDCDHQSTQVVDWLQGACLMIRREAVERTGPMDERFFLYFEDVDLARRMKEAGYAVYYVPEARFLHHYRRGSHGKVLSVEKLHHLNSALRYMNKWSPRGRGVLRIVREAAILLLLLLDLLIINGGFLFCLVLRDMIGGRLPQASTTLTTYIPLLGGANILLLATFASTGLYRMQRTLDWLGTVAQTVKAVTWVALAGSVLLFFAPAYRSGFVYSRLLLILYYFWLIGAVSVGRLLLKAGYRWFWRRHLLLRRMLLVGEAGPARLMAEAVLADPGAGYELCGLMTMPPDTSEDLNPELAQTFRDLLRTHHPGGVIFAAQRHSFRGYVPLVLESLERNLEVHVATSPDTFPYVADRSAQICGFPSADVTRTSLYSLKRLFKRLTDMLMAGTGILLLWPVILAFGILIRLHDSGPMFFTQRRLGKHGRPFRIIKLRTMRVDIEVDQSANIAEGPLTLIPNDPRVTPLGQWLRRHKVDELPQLVNVFIGDMSVVGPRPPMEEEAKQYTEWQKGRLFVRPGLTGLWQIDKERKWRFTEMVELDLKYILSWSVLMDYSIILRTLQVVLRGN